jgi:hypothetical protein
MSRSSDEKRTITLAELQGGDGGRRPERIIPLDSSRRKNKKGRHVPRTDTSVKLSRILSESSTSEKRYLAGERDQPNGLSQNWQGG